MPDSNAINRLSAIRILRSASGTLFDQVALHGHAVSLVERRHKLLRRLQAQQRQGILRASGAQFRWRARTLAVQGTLAVQARI
jgi:hypothetical protein